MDLTSCSLCPDDVEPENHLQCTSCKKKLHYICGLGFNDPLVEESFKHSASEASYICPICIVANNYEHLHRVIERQQELVVKKVQEAEKAVYDELSTTYKDLRKAVDISESDDKSHDKSVVAEETHSGQSQSQHVPSAPPLSPDKQGADKPPPPVQSPHIPTAPPKSPNVSANVSAKPSFKKVVPYHEGRRIKRCKGMLFGLKNLLCKEADTLIILDSNGRDIRGEKVDGSGRKVHITSIAGLCVPATTAALNECSESSLVYTQVKKIVFGLGTNDHLHGVAHEGEQIVYLRELDAAVKKIFPNAIIQFITPFSAIKKITPSYLKSLKVAIKGVGWRYHNPPSMYGMLTKPEFLHLSRPGRQEFINWLTQVFCPKSVVKDVHNKSGRFHSGQATHVKRQYSSRGIPRFAERVQEEQPKGAPPAEYVQQQPSREPSREPDSELPPEHQQQSQSQYSGLARELAEALVSVMGPPMMQTPVVHPPVMPQMFTNQWAPGPPHARPTYRIQPSQWPAIG